MKRRNKKRDIRNWKEVEEQMNLRAFRKFQNLTDYLRGKGELEDEGS
jgi:hypothetical protein